MPIHSSDHGLQNATGIVSALSQKIDLVTGIPYEITMTFFSIVGVGLLYLLFERKKKNIFDIFLLLAVTALMISFAVSTRLGASHIFVAIPFLVLYILNELSEFPTALKFMALQWYGMTLIYIIYIIFYRSDGVTFVS
jgi:hypothetical protein